jgi:hypothetical protein
MIDILDIKTVKLMVVSLFKEGLKRDIERSIERLQQRLQKGEYELQVDFLNGNKTTIFFKDISLDIVSAQTSKIPLDVLHTEVEKRLLAAGYSRASIENDSLTLDINISNEVLMTAIAM